MAREQGRIIEGEAREVGSDAGSGRTADERASGRPGGHAREGEGMALAIYILYLIGIVTGVAAVVGVILAHLFRGGVGAPWLATHYQFHVHTFWKGLVFFLLGAATSPIGIGIVILLLFAVWVAVRCALGIRDLMNDRPVPNPTTWGFY